MHSKKGTHRQLLSIEVIVGIIVICTAVYLHFTKFHRKKYPFQGLSNDIIKKLQNQKPLVIRKRGRSTSAKEEKARKILTKIYNKSFPPIRPNFLKNPTTGKNLEIDCYNDELKLGVEFNGIQHSKYTPHFHRNTGEFLYQVAKDDFKANKCKMLNITLIQIPHFVHINDLERYLRIKLQKAGKLM